VDKTCKSNGIFLVVISGVFSGVRVRNTWAICREVGDSSPKGELIPHVVRKGFLLIPKSVVAIRLTLLDEPAAYQLVGGVMAHQGNDG
jgi:hypothetical protein